MGKGFGGMPGNMQALMKQAQKMQQDLQRVQEEAEQLTAEGSAGGGAVKVIANGKHEIVSIAIQPEVVNSEDVEILQDLILLACNDALQKAGAQVRASMSKVTGGMNIPGM